MCVWRMSSGDEYEDDFADPSSPSRSSLKSQLTRSERRVLELEKEVKGLQHQLKVATQPRRSVRSGRRGRAGGAVADAPGTSSATASSTLCVEYKDLDLEEQVSGGGFCLLYRAAWMGIRVAVKRIFDPNITSELLAEFNNEVSMLSRLRHPHIVQVLAVVPRPPSLCIVCEWMARGSLHHVLHSSKVDVTSARGLRMAEQAAAALRYVHSRGIVHRDIKSLNLLADAYLRVKLCDFGLAQEKVSDRKEGKKVKIVGTPAYMAPELWAAEPATEASDVYAFGILFWEISKREVPFDGVVPAVIRDDVRQGVRPDLGAREVLMGVEGVADLIRSCWAPKASARPTFAKIVQRVKEFEGSVAKS